MKRALLIGLMVTSLAALVPADASPRIAFRFTGTMSLPQVPCLFNPCLGSMSGTVVGQLENCGPNCTGTMSGWFYYVHFPLACQSGDGWGSGQINGVPFNFTWGHEGAAFYLYADVEFHPVRGYGLFRTTPVVPSGCLPGGAPSAVSAAVFGVAAAAA